MQNTVEQVEKQPDESDGLIKTPRQLIVTVILAFIIPIFTIVMLVKLVSVSVILGGSQEAQTSDAIAKRIQPVAGFKLVDTTATTESRTGPQVYESTCAACHASGVADAPKLGDQAAWAPLIETGFDTMLKIALEGKGAMPPRGGNASLSDLEMARAVTYMANEAGASFPEPDENGSAAAAAAEPVAAAEEAPAQQSPAEAPAETQAAPQAEAAQVASTEIDPAGEKLYNTVCLACHSTGVAGAPKTGDKAAWAPLIETGFDAMLKIAIEGKGAMPPRGGSQASDGEVKAAVQFMLSKVQ